MNWEIGTDIYTTIYRNRQVMRTKCIKQEHHSGRHHNLNGKETQNRGDICINVTDSLCCTVETNITL